MTNKTVQKNVSTTSLFIYLFIILTFMANHLLLLTRETKMVRGMNHSYG